MQAWQVRDFMPEDLEGLVRLDDVSAEVWTVRSSPHPRTGW